MSESKEGGRLPDGASSSSGNGNSAEFVTHGNRKSAPVTNENGKSAPAANENGKSAPATNGNGNMVLATTAAKQVQQRAVRSEQKSRWIPKTELSFRPYGHRSSTGLLVNGICAGIGALEPHQHQGRVANGFYVEEGLQPKAVTRCPLAVKLTKDLVQTYTVCKPDVKKWLVLPKRYLTAPSNLGHGIFVRSSGLDDVGDDCIGPVITPSEEVSNDGPDNVATAINDLMNSQINPPRRYLTNPSAGVSNDGRDNVENDLILRVDDVLINSESNVHYVVKDILGNGSFGQVCKCWTSNPRYDRDHVAVKIIKNREEFNNLAAGEASICKRLTKFDSHDKGNIVRFLERFEFAGHSCLVFELLGIDLHELSRLNGCTGLSIQVVRRLTRQMLQALTALRAAGVMHCDIKPENIVLHPGPLEVFTVLILAALESRRNAGEIRPDLTEKDIILNSVFLERYAKIKVIDFGLASSTNSRSAVGRNTYIQSRYYRSPEVVLKLQAYTPAMDMWSLGCVVAELFLGIPLFPAANEYDLVRFMIDILGIPFPDDIICAADDEIRARFFKLECPPTSPDEMPSNGTIQPTYKFLSEADIEARVRAYGLGKPKAAKRHFGSRTLGDIIMYRKSRGKRRPEEMTEEISSRAAFLDFLMGVLHFDFRKRWTPRQALQHPFVTGEQFIGPFTPPPENIIPYRGQDVVENGV